MKKYIFCILLFFCWAVWKGISLHDMYPNPQILTYKCGETAVVGSYQITFDDWQWGDDGKSEDMRIGLIYFTITKVSESNDIFDISNIAFSSKAWENQFDMDLFYSLNPELNNMILDLSVGETQQFTLPLTVLESNFSTAQWADIDRREFYINIQYYPEHIRFLCPNVYKG